MKPTLVSRGKSKSPDIEQPEAEHADVLSEASLPALPELRMGRDAPIAFAPVVEIDPLHLEAERILPPGATGMNGGPYKMLRTQVLRRLDELGANSLAVVGTAAETGKTLTAINLAIAVAADLDRTALLVDLDLRKPSIARRFGISCEVGFEECLYGGVPLQQAIVRLVGYERLALLPARERCHDSSELLASRRAQDVISEIRARYKDRIVIFDLPPVLQADDALAFSRHVQAALLVVGEARTQRADVARTIELLRNLPVLGTVLNAARDATPGYYY
jgi:protein-tyrosine kinase